MSHSSPTIELVTRLPTVRPRPDDSNKGDFGRILVVGGSRGMSGAAVLCASAALRAGAGLVKIATSSKVQPIVALGNPCCTTAGLPGDSEGRLSKDALAPLLKLSESHDVIALGPGLDRSDELAECVIQFTEQCPKPIVIDADGLNAFIGKVDRLQGMKGPRVVTPHPGEFARLLQTNTHSVQQQRRELAIEFARHHGCTVALKGHLTVVTDGTRVYENTTGNPAMATGGTGDVLTGIIAALIGQHLEPFDAAQLGVYLHGLAGDLARDQLGIGLIATDLIDFLPAASRQTMR